MKVYVLKRDLPWAKAGTEWAQLVDGYAVLFRQIGDDARSHAVLESDITNVSDWFEPKETRWKPGFDKTVFYVTSEGKIEYTHWNENSNVCKNLYNTGNCFPSLDTAVEALRRCKATLLAYQEEISK